MSALRVSRRREVDKWRRMGLDAGIPEEFQTRLAAAVGLGVVVLAALWVPARILMRRSGKRPGLVFGLAALAVSAWLAGHFFFRDQEWVGHAGAVAAVALALLGWTVFDRLVFGRYVARRQGVEVPTILRQLVGVLVFLAALGAVLTWGYGQKVTGLLATSGVAAVILGFAMQDLLANVIAGFSIHMTRAYKVGDWLLLAEDGKRAEVREINWRSTRLIDNDLVSYEVPNSEIVKGRIVNLNHPGEEHAVRMRFGLDYDVPPNVVKEALLAATVEAQGLIEKPAPNVFLVDYGDSAVIYELRVWMRHARLFNACCDEIRTNLWYELNRRGLRIPFPIRTLEKRTPNVPAKVSGAMAGAASVVGRCGVLECLQEDQTKTLVAAGRVRLFGAGEVVVRRDEDGDSMFVILDGTANVVGKKEGGPRVVLAKLGTGECFGEMSLLTGEKRSATVRAESDLLLLEIRKRDLAPLLEEVPELVERMGELLEKRSRELNEATRGGEAPKAEAGPVRRSLVGRIRHFFTADA